MSDVYSSALHPAVVDALRRTFYVPVVKRYYGTNSDDYLERKGYVAVRAASQDEAGDTVSDIKGGVFDRHLDSIVESDSFFDEDGEIVEEDAFTLNGLFESSWSYDDDNDEAWKRDWRLKPGWALGSKRYSATHPIKRDKGHVMVGPVKVVLWGEEVTLNIPQMVVTCFATVFLGGSLLALAIKMRAPKPAGPAPFSDSGMDQPARGGVEQVLP